LNIKQAKSQTFLRLMLTHWDAHCWWARFFYDYCYYYVF